MRLDPRFEGGGRQRAARTVEIALLTGRPLSWWQDRAHREGVVSPWYVRISVPRAALHRRIEGRTRAMLEGGWIGEVKSLLESGVDEDAPGLDAVGYREIVRYLRGAPDRDALVSAVVTSTRQYAKRQETWFRHQLEGPVLNIDGTKSLEGQVRTVLDRWSEEQE